MAKKASQWSHKRLLKFRATMAAKRAAKDAVTNIPLEAIPARSSRRSSPLTRTIVGPERVLGISIEPGSKMTFTVGGVRIDLSVPAKV